MAYADTIDGKTVDRTYSKVVNLLDPVPFVRSFEIIKHSSDKHTLTINQNRFIGTYPTRDAALGALVGCSLKAGGGGGGDSQARAIKALNQMVTDGKGVFAGEGFPYVFSGTTDVSAFGGGSKDTNPTQSTTFAGLEDIEIRGEQSGATNERIIFDFSSTAERDAFIAAIPNGSDFTLALGGNNYSSVNGGIGWNAFGTVAMLQDDDILQDDFQSTVPSGTTYTLTFTE